MTDPRRRPLFARSVHDGKRRPVDELMWRLAYRYPDRWWRLPFTGTAWRVDTRLPRHEDVPWRCE